MDRKYAPDAIVPGTVYRIVREIGRGGMGRVYEIEDTTIGKRYALKVLRDAHASSPDQVERMKAESRTLARVAHPNIVDVITAGVTADGSFFYVMEMLEGRSLRRVLKDAVRLPTVVALRIGVDIGEALSQAHAEGVVHRDVKPDNIFIAKREMATSAKLLDFGVSALLDNLRTTLRETGKLLGTPRYASPQQQRGEKAHPSMDMWAFGYVLFEALVGHGPFRGRTLNEIIVAVQNPEPAFRLSDFVQDAPARLDDLLASMLEKEVRKRARSMKAVTDELWLLLQEERDAEEPLGAEDSTLESMIGLVNRTAPVESPARRPNENPRPDPKRPPTRDAAEADTATPPFFVDPPGTLSRGSARALSDPGSILPAGELADGEDDPEALDRVWGQLSTDTTAPALIAGNLTTAATVVAPVFSATSARVADPGRNSGARKSPEKLVKSSVITPDARTSVENPAIRGAGATRRWRAASSSEESESPSVRSSHGLDARTARQNWLVPAIAFGVTLAFGVTALLTLESRPPRQADARAPDTSARVVGLPPVLQIPAFTTANVASTSAPPGITERVDGGTGTSPGVGSLPAGTGSSMVALAPTQGVPAPSSPRPHPARVAPVPAAAPSTSPDDEFKYDMLLNR